MRLLVVSDRLPPDVRSGGGFLLEDLVNRLTSDHEVEVLRRRPGGARDRASLEVAVRASVRRFDPDVVVTHGPSLGGITRPVLELGAPEPDEAPKGVFASLRGRVRATRKRQAIVLVPSPASATLLAAGRQFRVVPPGVDAQRYSPSDVSSVQPMRVVFVGRLVPSRGAHIALEVFDGLPRWARESAHLDIVGSVVDRRYLDTLKRKASDLPVTLHTDVPDVLPFLRRASVAVLPPTAEDGWGRGILEAMACGVPVITSKGGVIETLTGSAAELVPAGNLKLLGEALRSLLRSAERRAELGAAGREHVLRRHAWEVALPQWVHALESVR